MHTTQNAYPLPHSKDDIEFGIPFFRNNFGQPIKMKADYVVQKAI